MLIDYNLPNATVFEITTSGIACGPVSNTVWFVLNLGVQVKDQD